MPKELSTSSRSIDPSVVANVRGEEGQFFSGKLVAKKTAPSQYKKQDGSIRDHNIYEFTLEETDMELTVKKGSDYVLVKDIKHGMPVSIFAPTRLHNALSQANIGDVITVTYTGLGKAGKKGGKPHTYKVTVE